MSITYVVVIGTKWYLTFQHWNKLSNHGSPSSAQILSCRHLLEEDRNSTGEHGNEVNEQEGPASILVAEVREPPDVAEADADTDAAEQEVQLVSPAAAVVLVVLVVAHVRAVVGGDGALFEDDGADELVAPDLAAGGRLDDLDVRGVHRFVLVGWELQTFHIRIYIIRKFCRDKSHAKAVIGQLGNVQNRAISLRKNKIYSFLGFPES